MALTTKEGQDWIDRTQVDDLTRETAKKIEALAEGLTPKQFTQAVGIALSDVDRYFILSPQSSLPELKLG